VQPHDPVHRQVQIVVVQIGARLAHGDANRAGEGRTRVDGPGGEADPRNGKGVRVRQSVGDDDGDRVSLGGIDLGPGNFGRHRRLFKEPKVAGGIVSRYVSGHLLDGVGDGEIEGLGGGVSLVAPLPRPL